MRMKKSLALSTYEQQKAMTRHTVKLYFPCQQKIQTIRCKCVLPHCLNTETEWSCAAKYSTLVASREKAHYFDHLLLVLISLQHHLDRIISIHICIFERIQYFPHHRVADKLLPDSCFWFRYALFLSRHHYELTSKGCLILIPAYVKFGRRPTMIVSMLLVSCIYA